MRNRFRPNVTPRSSRRSGPPGTSSSSSSTSSTSCPPVCEPEEPQKEEEPAVFIPPNSSRVLVNTESIENTERTEVVLSSVEVTSTVQEQDKSKPNAATTETKKRRPRLKPSVTPTARTRKKPKDDTGKTPQETNESSSAAAGEEVATTTTTTSSTTDTSTSKDTTTINTSKEQQAQSKSQSSTQHDKPPEVPKETGSSVSVTEGSQSSPGTLLARRKRAIPNIVAAARRRSSVSVIKESTSDKGTTQPESSVNQHVEEGSEKAISENEEIEERSNKRPRTASEPPLDNTIGVAEVIVESVTTETQPIEDQIIEQDEAEEITNRRVEEKKRKPRHSRPKEPLDPRKMTLQDLIYFNPKDNPMKSSVDAKRRRTEGRRKPSQSNESENGDANTIEADGQDDTDQANNTSEQTTEPSLSTDPATPQEEDEDRVHAPQVKIGADGCIILDEESLVIKSPVNSTLEKSDIVYEDSNNMNYAAFFKQSKRTKWSMPETLKFYKALSQVGTDFSLMLPLFPKRKRRELKAKFKREEKIHQDLVDRALVHRTPITIEMFKHPDQDKPEEDILDDVTPGNDNRNSSTAK